MTEQERISAFLSKWGPGGPGYGLNERQGAQQHFLELCAVLGVEAPTGGDDYLFEKDTLMLGHKRGFADVFKRGNFAWEYKAPGKPLDAALRQLMMYALALDNPPLLIVSDRLHIEIHTHFNGTPSVRHELALRELADPAKRSLLRRCFTAPDTFKPEKTNRQITEEAANAFATTAERLRESGVPAEVTSHLMTQCLFCFFAEDVALLPGRLFERLVGNQQGSAEDLRSGLEELFTKMRNGGRFGVETVPWFNGGLFEKVAVPPLSPMDVAALRNAASLNWSAIDPSIFGTLFERGLDPKKRSQLGAHYTDPATIMRLVEPVVQRPLRAEWERVKEVIAKQVARSKRAGDADYRKAEAAFVGFLEKLRSFRVLDPACGSGNFLYLALKALKDIEHQANIEAESLGLQRQVDAYTSPANVLGIELNEYAAELARVTVWIGELQWRLQHGYPFKVNPVLDPLDQIECRDALMNADGSEATWPKVSVVIGNPPFVGSQRMRSELGDEYTTAVRSRYAGRVPGGADLVCFWFDKARRQIEQFGCGAAGLVATNSIRGGRNREVLDAICSETRILEAWSDESWVNDGADVRVSLVAFGHGPVGSLDGVAASAIQSDLTAQTATSSALTSAARLVECNETAFQGSVLVGDFDVGGDVARGWLLQPNPTGDSSAAVLRPLRNARDITSRPRDLWVVDFSKRPAADAMMFELPFGHIEKHVKPARMGNRDKSRRERWWLHGRTGDDLRAASAGIATVIVTPRVSKYRLFALANPRIYFDDATVIVCRADLSTFGTLQSRMHELWSLALCTWLGVGNDPRYTPKSCFDTFPFPTGLTPADTAHQRTETLPDGAVIPADLQTAVRPHAEAIARAAKRLNDLREEWLNPEPWARRVPEVVPLGMDHSPYPDRIVAREGHEKELAERTLTKLYNQRPPWLVNAHQALDAAVAAAYGWADYTPDMADEEILRRLLALNRERAAAQTAKPASAGKKV